MGKRAKTTAKGSKLRERRREALFIFFRPFPFLELLTLARKTRSEAGAPASAGASGSALGLAVGRPIGASPKMEVASMVSVTVVRTTSSSERSPGTSGARSSHLARQ